MNTNVYERFAMTGLAGFLCNPLGESGDLWEVYIIDLDETENPRKKLLDNDFELRGKHNKERNMYILKDWSYG